MKVFPSFITGIRGIKSPVTSPEFGSLFPWGNISGLVAWYRVSDSSTVTKDGSNRVSSLADKSGNVHTLTQSSASNKPTWVAAHTNGKDALHLDRTTASQFLSSAPFTLNQPCTFFCLCYIEDLGQFPGRDDDNYVFDGVAARCAMGSVEDNTSANVFTVGADAGIKLESPLDTPQLYVLTGHFDAASSSFFYNQTALNLYTPEPAPSNDAGSNNPGGITIGCAAISTSFGINAYVYELVVFQGSISAPDRTTVISYLMNQGGL